MSEAAILHDPAFRLLAACADWPRGEKRNAAIIAAAEALGGNYSEFLARVKRHRMAPLALDGFVSAGLEVPDKLLRLARNDKRQALRSAAEGLRLIEVLGGAGIGAVILKGPLVSQQIYGGPAMRQCKDLDLLVDEADLAQARRLLGQQAYRLDSPEPPWGEGRMRYWRIGAKDLALSNPEKRVAVELHYRLKTATGLIPGLGMADAREVVTLAGTPLRSFAQADLFVYLAVHGATTLWHRVKWLADLRALLAGRDKAEITQLLEHARSLGVERCAALALLLCERLWDQQLPDAVLAMRTSDRRLALLEQRSLQALGDPDPKLGSIGNRRLASTAFRLRDDWAYRRSLLASMLFDPQIISTIKLPRALGLLYVPARLLSWRRNRMK